MERLQEDTISDQLKDNIGGQRSKFDVMATILNICQEGSLKNHIIGKGNFSDAMANHYLTILLYHGLIASSKEDGRNYYRTTDKGRQLISHYLNIQNLFKAEAPMNPAHSVEQENTQVPRDSSSQLDSSKRILIVDDESDISSAMKIGLEDRGFSVMVHNDPHTALSSYRPGTYDLLILDVKMPKMNGFDLYREIRKVDDKATVCFLTAFEMYGEEFKRVFPSMGVKHFIQKPISMSELVEQIGKITGQGR